MAQPFADHFSGHSSVYARFRPTYPDDLFRWLAEQAPGRSCAWDAATGNGQAALALVTHFHRVHASDAAAAQLAQLPAHPRITARQAPAEASGLPDQGIDLVTVAQALHWFDLDAFHAEVARVLVPGGLLAAWCYGLFQISPAVDAVVWRLYDGIVGEDWPPERRILELGYRDLAWPWEPVAAPTFAMQADWDLQQVQGYLGTWSACKRYEARTGQDPLQQVADALASAWGDPAQRRRVSWPLSMRVGRKPG